MNTHGNPRRERLGLVLAILLGIVGVVNIVLWVTLGAS